MGEVVELRGRADHAGPDLDLVASKLRRPRPRPETVRRAVLGRLIGAEVCPVVTVVAPAGYGKTTLLAEWAERDGRPFAWVSADERDNDPRVFLGYVAAALDQVERVGHRVFDALGSQTTSVSGTVVPRLASALATMGSSAVLVIDDVHLLTNRECRSALSVLAENVPTGSVLVLAGRNAPPVRVARLRAEGRVTEVGVADLALTPPEAARLLRAAGAGLDDADVATLHSRTEGWPVGLYLAALYLREGGSVLDAAASFGGDDRLVSEYLESELLARISGPHRAFLTRSAALRSMSGALCSATLDLPDAAATLAELAGSNTLLVPLDRRGQWYRYHHLFGDMLRAELDRREPGVMAAVRWRAAQWCVRNDQPEEAVEYAIEANDIEFVARLVEQIGFGVYWHGQRDRLDRWIRWLEARNAIRARPMVAVIAGFLCMSTLRIPEAARWAGLLDQWQREADWAGDRATEANAAMLRASVCRFGADQMRADVDEAIEKFAAEGIETPNLVVYRALVCLLMGQVDTADALWEDAVTGSERDDLQEILACALYERAVIAMARGDWKATRDFADRLRDAIKRPGGSEELFVPIVQARVAAHHGDLPAAREALTRAQLLRPLMPMPVFAVQNRLELARAYVAIDDLDGARTVTHEADEILERHPNLGTLVDDAADMRTLLGKRRRSGAVGPSALTAAELRLLPMLTTHLTYPEIADELSLSKHTIHAQARSIFRKLGATTRSQAITRSQELGLLER